MKIPQRLYWKDKGEIISQSTWEKLATNMQVIDVYAIVPDDIFEYLISQMQKEARMPLSEV